MSVFLEKLISESLENVGQAIVLLIFLFPAPPFMCLDITNPVVFKMFHQNIFGVLAQCRVFIYYAYTSMCTKLN